MMEMDNHIRPNKADNTSKARESGPYLYCIRILAKRDYSQFKLREKLKNRKYSTEEINETISILLEKNYLREDNYTKARIQGLINKYYSASFIKYKLEQEQLHVSLEAIYEVYKDLGITEDEQKSYLIEKKLRSLKYRNLDEFKTKQKIWAFLKSKGH